MTQHIAENTRVSIDRIIALSAILVTAMYHYGIRILILALVCMITSLLTEWICCKFRNCSFRKTIPDTVSEALILCMLFSTAIPFFTVIVSCIVSVVLGKELFGGKNNPVVPSVAVGYCFAWLNQNEQLLLYPSEKIHLSVFSFDSQLLTGGVSEAWNKSGTFSKSVLDWLTGIPNEPIGTCSVVLLSMIGIVLILRKSASGWVILPLLFYTVCSNIIFAKLRHIEAAVVGTMLTNQLLFSAIFIYGDMDYAPPDLAGILFGVFSAGAITAATRFLFVTDAPLMLSIILSPLAIWLRYMMNEYAFSQEDKRRNTKCQGKIRYFRIPFFGKES